jgi:hypothetical protein
LLLFHRLLLCLPRLHSTASGQSCKQPGLL